MILIKKDKAKNIAKHLSDYYKIIEKNYKSNNDKELNEGYLINKKVLDDLEEKVLYQYYLSNPQEYENKFNEKYKSIDKLSINNYEKIEFITYKEMMRNLKDQKEYAILNFIIWASIKNTNLVEKKIYYKVKNKQLIFKLNDAETIYFNCNSNIINEDSFIKVENSNEKKINKTFDCIKKYYKFKKSLIKELNEEKNTSRNYITSSQLVVENEQKEKGERMLQSMQNLKVQNLNEIKVGFLIKNEIFKEWEKYTDYENLKNKNIISGNKEEIEEIKEYINKNFIVNKPKLDNIKTKEFKNSSEITSYLNTHLNLILVNAEFFDLVDIKKKNELKNIKFSINKNHIDFNFNLTDKKNKSESLYYSYNNIISSNTSLNLSLVNNLIELYTFQESLKLKLKQKKKEKISMKLVDKEWIFNIKSHYNYNTLCDLIKNSKIIKDKINNFESINNSTKLYYLKEVLKDLPENFLDDLLFNFYLKEENNNKKYELSYKKEKIEYNISTKEIKYINNFEFIDSKLFHHLMEININKKEKEEDISRDVTCYIFGNKLLIIYENKSNVNTYICGYINNENLFISEYYFDYLNIQLLEKKDSLDIFKILKNNESKNYFNLTSVDNQTVVHCFKLKSDESQNTKTSYLEKEDEETKGNIQLNEKEIEKKC